MGGVFAAIARASSTRSRAAVGLALVVDAALGALAAFRLAVLLRYEGVGHAADLSVAKLLAPTAIERVVPAIAVAMGVTAFVVVLLDWRQVLATKWVAAAEPL